MSSFQGRDTKLDRVLAKNQHILFKENIAFCTPVWYKLIYEPHFGTRILLFGPFWKYSQNRLKVRKSFFPKMIEKICFRDFLLNSVSLYLIFDNPYYPNVKKRHNWGKTTGRSPESPIWGKLDRFCIRIWWILQFMVVIRNWEFESSL